MRVDLDQIVFLCVCFFVLKVMHKLSRVDMQIACSLNLFYSQSKVFAISELPYNWEECKLPLITMDLGKIKTQQS